MILEQNLHVNEQSMAPRELRQFLLTELEVYQQAIEGLSDVQLEAVVGGATENQGATTAIATTSVGAVGLVGTGVAYMVGRHQGKNMGYNVAKTIENAGHPGALSHRLPDNLKEARKVINKMARGG